ncbi:MAG: c-type cytochrome [Nitrospiria bacterium]
MKPSKIIGILLFMIVLYGAFVHLVTKTIAPNRVDPMVTSFDISRPRAPAEARKIKNPVPVSEDVIEKGKKLYLGKGGCIVCHGEEGKGDGEGGHLLNPPPRDLTNPNFHLLRTDGEMFWSIKNGVEGTGMFSYAPRIISEEDAWKVIHFIRTLKQERT